MGEIIRSDFAESESIQWPEGSRVRDLPESVRTLFAKLPAEMQRKLLPESDQKNNGQRASPENYERRLEELAASFDTRTREKYMAKWLENLFMDGQYRNHRFLQAAYKGDLKNETTRLMDVIWGQRGQKGQAAVFNESWYKEYADQSGMLRAKIKNQKEAITRLETSIEKTRKQKRLTAVRIAERRQLVAGLEALEKELGDLHYRYGNSDNERWEGRGIAAREKAERELTKAAAVMSGYLDATEYATVMAEQVERFIFFREKNIADQPQRPWYGHVPTADQVKWAKEVIGQVEEAIARWHDSHGQEQSLKSPKEPAAANREAKLADYFQTLVDSYLYGKKQWGKTDEDLVVNIRSMEVALNLLNQKAGG